MKHSDYIKNPRKLPPFGKSIAERQKFQDPPWLIVICVGAGAWDSAKTRNQRCDSAAMVLLPGESPSAFIWPVSGCLVVVEWNHGPGENLIIELVKALLLAGSQSVTVWPVWADYTKSIVEYDPTKPVGSRFVQIRECIRTYRLPRKDDRHVA